MIFRRYLPRRKDTPVLFLDRDGTLNRDIGYTWKAGDLEWIFPEISNQLKILLRGFTVVIISNQSGINRGYFRESDFWEFTEKLIELARKKGIEIEFVIACPHDPINEVCLCRKPGTQMVEKVLSEYSAKADNSIMVGDSESDKIMSMKAGLNFIEVNSDHFLESLQNEVARVLC